MELENQLDACSVANSGKIKFGSYVLMYKCWGTLSCLNSSQYIFFEIVNIISTNLVQRGVGVGRTEDRKSQTPLHISRFYIYYRSPPDNEWKSNQKTKSCNYF
jgi:hypothetical protein